MPTARLLLPFDVWAAQQFSASVPANDNALRAEVIAKPAESFAATEPVSPADGDLEVVDGTWGYTFTDPDGDPVDPEGLLALYRSGTWYYFQPFLGQYKDIAGQTHQYDPDSATQWQPVVNGAASVVGDATTARNALPADAGDYVRFTSASAKTFTFDSAQTYVVGAEYHARNVGAGDLTLTEAGTFQLNPPTAGTLVVPQDGTVTVKIVGATEADVIGVTVPL